MSAECGDVGSLHQSNKDVLSLTGPASITACQGSLRGPLPSQLTNPCYNIASKLVITSCRHVLGPMSMNLCRRMQLHQSSSSLGGLAGMTGRSRHSRDQRSTAHLFIHLFNHFVICLVQRCMKVAGVAPPQMQELIKLTDPGAIIEHGLFVRQASELDKYAETGWGKGRVTLIGDAAHPMRPTGGLPLCQAHSKASMSTRLHLALNYPACMKIWPGYDGLKLMRPTGGLPLCQAHSKASMSTRLHLALKHPAFSNMAWL